MASTLNATRYETPLGERSGRNHVLVELAAQGHRILEFGCANGFISRHLAERGCVVTGVERDPEAAEQAKQWCEKVCVADIDGEAWWNAVGRGFDTILFGDVLEHLVYPERTLRRAAELLSPDGRIIVCLPNVAHWRVRAGLLRGKFDYQTTGILDATHLHFYSVASARKFLAEAGCRVVSAHFFVGGSGLTRRLRLLFPGVFAVQMLFVARPVGQQTS